MIAVKFNRSNLIDSALHLFQNPPISPDVKILGGVGVSCTRHLLRFTPDASKVKVFTMNSRIRIDVVRQGPDRLVCEQLDWICDDQFESACRNYTYIHIN